jgi:hypothetical protein
MVSVLGPLFRTAGHLVRTQHGVTASAGQRRGDAEVWVKQPRAAELVPLAFPGP